MNIAFLVDSFPKISETFVLNQITGLLDRGHDIKIFARRDPQEQVIHEDVRKYDLISKTYYANIPDNKLHRAIRASKLLALYLPKNTCRVIESLRFKKYGRDAFSLRMLYYSTNFEDDEFDILFCHFGLNGNLGALLKETGTDAQVVTMFHGYDVRLEVGKASMLYQPVFEHSDLLLANSIATRDKLIAYGADPNDILCHPVGINPSQFSCHIDSSHKTSTTPITITTIGRLVKVKGHKYAIRGISDLLKKNPDLQIEYRLIGGGPERGNLEKLTRKLGIESSVTFTGQVDRTTVREHLNETNIFLLPSIDEGLGMVLLEAQASGIPIVATDTGGVPQAVDCGGSTLLVPPKDPMALSEKIEYLCENPDQWEPMGKAGRKYVEENFNTQKLIPELESILTDLNTGER